MRYSVVLLLFAGLPQESKYRIPSLDGDRKVDYLVLSAETFANDCDALLAYREKQGLKVGIVTYAQVRDAAKGVEAGPDAILAVLKKIQPAWGVTYLLIVGDARGEEKCFVPMREEAGGYFSEKYASEKELATDWAYATLGGKDPVIHVGRFPCDTSDELKVMIEKTLAYETKQKPGPWQRRISFITGEGGFGPMVDQLIEAQFTKIVSERIPPPYTVEVAYAQTTSKYCPYPPKFNENAVRLLNEGGLFYVYVGHGWREGCDQITFKSKNYDILSSKNAKDIDIPNGLPVMVVIACSTGFVDAKSGDCLGEVILKLAKGPPAFVGGSRVTQPYGNALLGKELVDAVFAKGDRTFGEMFDEARAKILAPDESGFRKTADNMAGAMQGKDSLEGMRNDVVRHYNLLGDPALKLRKPPETLALETLGIEAAGRTLTVKGKAPFAEGRAMLSFECPREKFAREIPKISTNAPDFEEKISKRYQDANDKAYARLEVELKEGAFTADVAIPEGLAKGAYVLKAFAWNGSAVAAGAKTITLSD
jgi:hypothetical protein